MIRQRSTAPGLIEAGLHLDRPNADGLPGLEAEQIVRIPSGSIAVPADEHAAAVRRVGAVSIDRGPRVGEVETFETLGRTVEIAPEIIGIAAAVLLNEAADFVQKSQPCWEWRQFGRAAGKFLYEVEERPELRRHRSPVGM